MKLILDNKCLWKDLEIGDKYWNVLKMDFTKKCNTFKKTVLFEKKEKIKNFLFVEFLLSKKTIFIIIFLLFRIKSFIQIFLERKNV